MKSIEPESQSDVLPPIPPFTFLGILSPLLVLPALIPSIIILFAPVDILERLPILQKFTSWMVAHVPYMDGHANSTIYPQLALLVNCLVVALVPYMSAVLFVQAWINYPYLLKRRKAQGPAEIKLHFFLLLYGPPCFLATLAAMVMIPGDPSWAQGTTTHKRGIFYAFSSFMMPYYGGLVFGVQLLNIRLFIDTYLRR